MFGSKHNIQKDLAELRQQIVENSLELQAVTQVRNKKLQLILRVNRYLYHFFSFLRTFLLAKGLVRSWNTSTRQDVPKLVHYENASKDWMTTRQI